eukprot:2865080-Prymnesium_polylepis.1
MSIWASCATSVAIASPPIPIPRPMTRCRSRTKLSVPLTRSTHRGETESREPRQAAWRTVETMNAGVPRSRMLRYFLAAGSDSDAALPQIPASPVGPKRWSATASPAPHASATHSASLRTS